MDTSYWNNVTSGQAHQCGGQRPQHVAAADADRARCQLRAIPITAWATASWDFGTNSQYPVLKGLGLTVAAQRALFADIELTVNPATITENGGAQNVTVTARLASGTAASNTTVALVLGGTAVKDTDYTVSPAVPRITIASGDSSGTVTLTLTPADDRLIEGAESIVVSGTSGDLIIGRAAIALTDNDAASTAIALSVAPTSLAEAANSMAVTVTAELDDGALSTDTTVTLSLGGVAKSGAGKDYTFTPTTLPTITIPANRVSGTATINIDPLQDDIDEGTGEAITVGGTHSGSLTVTATNITISDDDTAGSTIALSVSPDSIDENAAGDSDGNIEITVTATLQGTKTRSADTVVAVTSTLSGTATKDTDYTHTTLPTSITIAGEAASGSATFKVNPHRRQRLRGQGDHRCRGLAVRLHGDQHHAQPGGRRPARGHAQPGRGLGHAGQPDRGGRGGRRHDGDGDGDAGHGHQRDGGARGPGTVGHGGLGHGQGLHLHTDHAAHDHDPGQQGQRHGHGHDHPPAGPDRGG